MSKRYVNYDFYENGIEESVNGEKVNQIFKKSGKTPDFLLFVFFN